MSSNSYIVVDEDSGCCFCIDPASEKSEKEIKYISEKGLTLEYVIVTHEHMDHTWGVNALLDAYPMAKVVCSEVCQEAIPQDASIFFSCYYDNMDYEYQLKKVDYTTEALEGLLNWHGHKVSFINTPGHSPGSVCIAIDDLLFGGDTLLQFKPFIVKRKGGSKEKFAESIAKIQNLFAPNTMVYPGHGEPFELHEIQGFFK